MKPFFVSIPHSGEMVPEEATWLKGLPETFLMCDVDRYVDRLYEPCLKAMRIPYTKTQWHRYAIDLNRLPDDVDSNSVLNHKNAAGKFSRGLHWVITTKSERLMPQPISLELHDLLVTKYFEPFHVQVRKKYSDFFAQGVPRVFHIDAHSMPSVGTKEHRDPGEYRKDIVISDNDGTTCSKDYLDIVMNAYSEAGFEVGYNWPYKAGRVTETYGHPEQGQEAIQVELNRALYMDEVTKKILPEEAEEVSRRISLAIQTIYKSLPDV